MKRKKRKSFANVFWGKFFWITFVLTGLCLFGLFIFVTINKDNCWNGFWEVEKARLDNIQDAAEGGMDDFARKQQFRGAIMAEANQVVSVLYDTDTKELIAGCEEQIVIFRSRSDEAPSTVYCYPTADVPGWKEHREKVAELKTPGNIVYETIDMSHFYQKGDRVVPGSFTVTVTVSDLLEYEMAEDGYEPEYAFVSSFDMSGVIPDDYEQKEIGEGDFKLIPLIVGYSPSNSWLQRYGGIDRAYKLLQEEYAALQANGKELGNYEEWTFFTLTMTGYSEMDLENGQTVALFSVARYDLWETYKIIFFIIAGVLLMFDIVLALILAKISYTQIKAQYDMIDYRKTLMNTMAHDLKSPLMSISGYAENLADNMASGKQEHYANAILENVQYMNGIVESVLALSKTEQEGILPNKKELDVPALLQEVRKRYELQLEEKELQLAVNGQLTLKADESLMAQTLDNLLGNAVKYATPGSTIEVVFDTKYMEMNNACEEDLSDVADTLCEPFVVGSKSRSGKTGSGMGLAIVKNICELHGYRLQVACEKGHFMTKIIFSKK